MSDQQPPNNGNSNNSRPPNNNGGGQNNNNRRPQNNPNANPNGNPNNNQRRRPQGPNPNNNRPNNAAGGAPGNPGTPQNNARPNNNPQGGQQPTGGQGGNNNRRRHGRNHNNRPRNPNGNPNGQPNTNQSNQPQGLNVERIYEKYLNLLDQHLIARRKYHDLFYRADPAQKNKLERNFYNTLNDIRDFEARLAPEARALFEKRNNGLSNDNIYTTNHELPTVGEAPPPETEWADPHYLQSQKQSDFADDKEESVGSADDYLKYKNLL